MHYDDSIVPHCLVIVCVGTFAVLISKIRKSKVSIEEAVFWILLSLMFVIFALFPVVPDTLAALLAYIPQPIFCSCLSFLSCSSRMFWYEHADRHPGGENKIPGAGACLRDKAERDQEFASETQKEERT
jgi:hypothetical protein